MFPRGRCRLRLVARWPGLSRARFDDTQWRTLGDEIQWKYSAPSVADWDFSTVYPGCTRSMARATATSVESFPALAEWRISASVSPFIPAWASSSAAWAISASPHEMARLASRATLPSIFNSASAPGRSGDASARPDPAGVLRLLRRSPASDASLLRRSPCGQRHLAEGCPFDRWAAHSSAWSSGGPGACAVPPACRSASSDMRHTASELGSRRPWSQWDNWDGETCRASALTRKAAPGRTYWMAIRRAEANSLTS